MHRQCPEEIRANNNDQIVVSSIATIYILLENYYFYTLDQQIVIFTRFESKGLCSKIIAIIFN